MSLSNDLNDVNKMFKLLKTNTPEKNRSWAATRNSKQSRVKNCVVVRLNFDRRSFGQNKDYFVSRKKKVPFRMAIGNGELMHECSPSSMGTARMKFD